MAAKIIRECFSNEKYLSAAVFKGLITNPTQLLQLYASRFYKKIPYAKFQQSGTIFFLTGGTRHAASKIAHQGLLKGAKSKMQKKR